MTRTENTGHKRAATPAAPTFPLGVKPGTLSDARELAEHLPPWAAYAVMAFWLDGQPDGVDLVEAARQAGYRFDDEQIPEIRRSLAKGWRSTSEILTTSGADWRMP